jgi:putative membrane protein insertion efficiency factor
VSIYLKLIGYYILNNAAKLVALQLLQAYKWAISPMLPTACRYVPTCSDYALEAIDRFGVLRGGYLALTRLLRCHPFSRSGYDPVPRSLTNKLTGKSLPPCGPCAPQHLTSSDFTPGILTR